MVPLAIFMLVCFEEKATSFVTNVHLEMMIAMADELLR